MPTIHDDFEAWPRGPLHVAIGVFDGVHLGHRALVRRIADLASASGGSALATTFDPLPVEVLAPGAPPIALTDIDERAALLGEAGADAVAILHFNAAFAAIEAEEFIRRVAAAGDVRDIHVGRDFRFGRDRGGDVRMLEAFAPRHGYVLHVAPTVIREGQVVSSTRVRNALLAGDVRGAAQLLGRRYAVAGVVEPRDTHGRSLGFPTVSLTVPSHRLLPRDGIYALWATVRDERIPAAATIGVRSTSRTAERRLELYLLDPSGDLYGEHLRVEFVQHLRDELRFETSDELRRQITQDIAQTRAVLGSENHL